MMSRIDAHAMAKNTFVENFSVQKCLTIIFPTGRILRKFFNRSYPSKKLSKIYCFLK